jgi:hypothetical protein
MIAVACVRSGTKYSVEYVERLRSMVARYLPQEHRFICLTDQPDQIAGVEMIDCLHLGWHGWWLKMGLFDPDLRGPDRCLYFDLDTVIIDDLTPLAEWGGEFGICRNFTKLAGHPTWPCNYGSCVMSLAPGFGRDIYRRFSADPQGWVRRCPHGDQQAIEKLYPRAEYLQDRVPPGYFVGRRDFNSHRPKAAAVMIFAGRHKPHNTPHRWLKEAWQ